MTRALITGITGQDGSYLAEQLLAEGVEVHGVIRRSSSFNTGRIDHIFGRLHLHYGDLTDGSRLAALVAEIRPDEVYNLGAQSHVAVSFENPVYTAEVDALGTLRLLEACRRHAPGARFYQASTSELFGQQPAPQSEETAFNPVSPYGIAKLFAHQAAVMHREAYGMHVSCGILFNHESPRRGETFVTRKITRAVARIACGLQEELNLGSLWPVRDWGWAPDYVRAMTLMARAEEPGDYVIATGVGHTVGEWLDCACGCLGARPGVLSIDVGRYVRPIEVPELVGDARKARAELGWSPAVGFEDIVERMVASDLALARAEAAGATARQ